MESQCEHSDLWKDVWIEGYLKNPHDPVAKVQGEPVEKQVVHFKYCDDCGALRKVIT